MVFRKSHQKAKVNIVEVVEMIRSKQTETTDSIDSPKISDTTPVNTESETAFHEDVERVKINCCDVIKVSGGQKLKEMYPAITGVYRKTTIPSFRPTYIKITPPTVYISQPEVQKNSPVVGYSWGLSKAPQAKWGYIRSTKTGACPTMAGRWKIYNKISRRWEEDKRLRLRCVDI